MDAPRPARRPADPADRRRPARSRTASSSPSSAIRTAPNEERGVFRSTDGGATFEKVLYKDENTGAIDVVARSVEPATPSTPPCGKRGRGRGRTASSAGPGSGLYKSTDGGTTWRQLTNGLPTFEPTASGRIGIDVAPSDPQRLFATVDARRSARPLSLRRRRRELARWSTTTRASSARGSRLRRGEGRPEEPGHRLRREHRDLEIDRRRQDVHRAARRARRRRLPPHLDQPEQSGHHAHRVRPGRDHHGQRRRRPGARWYNQPTAQFYHVSTDNAFPYRVCGGQQESGSACVASRGDDGQITFRDWHPVGVEEYGYVAPDPLDPDIVYGGKLTRFDRRTGQVQNVAPAAAARRRTTASLRTAPVLFSPVDPHTLYFAVEHRLEDDERRHELDADQPGPHARDVGRVPPNVGKYYGTPAAQATQPRRDLHPRAVARSTINRIWAGTDDGLIHVTRDGGKTWTNVTPPDLARVEQGLADRRVALRTRYGVRRDQHAPPRRPAAAHLSHPRRRQDVDARSSRACRTARSSTPCAKTRSVAGCCSRARSRQVYVSFDDGDRWQSLRLNMPATSIRDLVIKDDDLVVGTHGAVVLDPRRHHAAAAARRTARSPSAACSVQAAAGVRACGGT